LVQTDSDDAYLAWRNWTAARKAEYMANENISEELAERLAREDWDNSLAPGREPPR
jgi:hypothetical protein